MAELDSDSLKPSCHFLISEYFAQTIQKLCSLVVTNFSCFCLRVFLSNRGLMETSEYFDHLSQSILKNLLSLRNHRVSKKLWDKVSKILWDKLETTKNQSVSRQTNKDSHLSCFHFEKLLSLDTTSRKRMTTIVIICPLYLGCYSIEVHLMALF